MKPQLKSITNPLRNQPIKITTHRQIPMKKLHLKASTKEKIYQNNHNKEMMRNMGPFLKEYQNKRKKNCKNTNKN